MRTLTIAVVAAVVAFVATTAMPGANAGPAGSEDKSGVPLQSQPSGPYGSDSFYSSDEEVAALGKVADVATTLHALGEYRTGQSTMLLRLPSDTVASSDDMPSQVAGFAITYEISRFTADSLAQLQELVTDEAQRDDYRSTFGMHYDVISDVVDVRGAFSQDFAAFLTSTRGISAVADASAERNIGRADDPAPHWGGAEITDNYALCTSGFSVVGSSGTNYMLTAGHCFADGADVYSPGTGGTGEISFGHVEHVASPFPNRDMELIGGSTYDHDIWMGTTAASATFKPVAGAQDATVGEGLCVSGAQSFENCGKIVDSVSSGSLCDASGCTPYCTTYHGGDLTIGGDSGAPLVHVNSTTLGVRGIHIGLDGSEMYAQRWASIQAVWPGIEPMT